MFSYEPKKLRGIRHDPAVGPMAAEFEAFEPNPKYAFGPMHVPPYAPLREIPSHIGRDAPTDCPPITPVKSPPPRDGLSLHVRNLVKALWKQAEPAQGAQRGSLQIGGARGRAGQQNESFAQRMLRQKKELAPYRSQVSPTGASPESFAESEMTLDWKEMDQIQRTSAFTFRGDRDGPATLLNARGGFKPPATRTDRSYLEGDIYSHFAGYLKRRYDRELTKEDFLAAIDRTLGDRRAQETLIAYLLWRKLVEKEQFHLGRMTVDECLKAFISTSTSLPVSMYFASGRGTGAGWMYVTFVSNGFSVPNYSLGSGENHKWATGEHEIAQMGPIPPDRIVGFRHVANLRTLDGPVYFRESFRKSEAQPFGRMFDILSGMRQ
ncbi:MAG: hypothetical protein ABIX12_00695 [Rubrivivax sp.]